jgi:hypothetical protein
MKKLLVVYSLLLFGFSNAQSIKYGVTGSVHKGSMPGIHGVGKPNWGGSLGVFADFSLVPNDIYDSAWLYFTPQLEVFTLGERGDWNEDNKDVQKYNLYYVGVPLYIKYFIKNHGYKGDIYFMAGPKLEFLAARKDDEGNAVKEAIAAGFDPNKFGLGQRINYFSYGVSVKLGVKVNDMLDVFMRYDRGFAKLYPDYTAQNTHTRFLAIGVSYYIGSID